MAVQVALAMAAPVAGQVDHAAGAADAGHPAVQRRACLWGLPGVTGREGTALVTAALGDAHASTLVSVHKCTQRDGRIRWDIVLTLDGFEAALSTLVAGSRRRGWYVRAHVPYAARHADGQPPARRIRPAQGSRSVTTLNIGTATRKLEELSGFLVEQHVAVLAVQETLHSATGRPMRIEGYDVLERHMDKSTPGARGVALMVRQGIPAHAIGGVTVDPNVMWARVVGLCGDTSCWTMASVYVPHTGAGVRLRRAAVLDHIKVTAPALMERYGDEPMALMGDWNMSLDRLKRLLSRWGSGLFALPLTGAPGTYPVPGKMPTAIDHIVVNEAAFRKLCGARVMRDVDLSDHWPVRASVRVVAPAAAAGSDAEAPVPRLDARKIREAGEALRMHNAFEVLCEGMDTMAQDDVAGAVDAFTTAAREACAAVGAVRQPRSGSGAKAFAFSAKTKTLIRKRKDASAKVHVGRVRSRDPVLLQRLREAQKRARAAQEADVARCKLQRLVKGLKGMKSERPDVFWRWLREELHGRRSATDTVTPVRDAKGELQVTAPAVQAVWHAHYSGLSKATGGVRESKGTWAERNPLPQKSELQGMDADIEWQEMVAALRAMTTGSAPGVDGIPADLLMAALRGADGLPVKPEDVAPDTHLGQALMRVAKIIWDNGKVPPSMVCATLVPIPKAGGDSVEVAGHRGVSLISTTLKLVARIVADRVTKGLTGAGRIAREQAGFRSREECMGQVCALLEAAARRARAGKATWCAFIDFKAAFDMVPHGALLHMMDSAGVRGKALAFCAALYKEPTFRVRVGDTLSAVVALEQGVRQGDPLSPILFDLFINGIIDGMAGVGVPGLPAEHAAKVLAALMFADDVVLTQESPEALQAALDTLAAWADKWGMRVGHRKCGVMVLGSATAQEAARGRVWTVQGATIPVVDAYPYLGVVIDPGMTMKANLARRVAKGSAALQATRWVLTDRTVPLTVRAMVYRTLVHPVLTFGGEVTGLSGTHRLHPLQRLQNKAMKWLAVGSAAASLGVVPLMAELGIPPVAATMAGAKVRAMRKYPDLVTWVALLAGPRSPMKAAPKGAPTLWSSRSKGAATRLVKDWRERAPKAVGRLIVKRWAERYLKRKAATSKWARRYVRAAMAESRGYLKHSVLLVADAAAISWLTRARTGMHWAGHIASAAGHIAASWRRKCVACGKEQTKDNLSHIVFSCRAYAPEREAHLSQLIQQARDAARESSAARLRKRDLLALLLGGSISLEGSPFRLGSAWLPGLGKAKAAGEADGQGPRDDHGDEGDAGAAGGNAAAAGDAAEPNGGGAAGHDATQQGMAYLTVARYLGIVMPAHHRRIQALALRPAAADAGARGDGNDPGAAAPGAAHGGSSGRRHRRRANALDGAGQLLRVDGAG